MTMAYEKQTWNNNDPETPLSAARFSHMEDGISDADSKAEAAQSTADQAAPGDHSHEMSDVTGLDSALSGKANASSLSGKADQSALDALDARVAELESKVEALEAGAGGA